MSSAGCSFAAVLHICKARTHQAVGQGVCKGLHQHVIPWSRTESLDRSWEHYIEFLWCASLKGFLWTRFNFIFWNEYPPEVCDNDIFVSVVGNRSWFVYSWNRSSGLISCRGNLICAHPIYPVCWTNAQKVGTARDLFHIYTDILKQDINVAQICFVLASCRKTSFHLYSW